MNKGKICLRTIDNIEYTMFLCNRCGVVIPAEKWINNSHDKCDYFLSKKPIRGKAQKLAMTRLFGKGR